jgi:hypothetical protein
MRRILVASLLSSFALAAFAATPTPKPTATPVSTPGSVRPVTTGITAPKLETAAVVHIDGDESLTSYPSPASMQIHLSVDATGATTQVQVVRSLSPVIDAQVVRAVSKFRWHPAMLDNQNIPADVNLMVDVQH